MDLHQLVYWVIVTAFFLALPFLWGGERIRRLGSWAIDRLTPDLELDPTADEFAEAFRRQQLVSQVRRLQEIMATDASMSAARQMGNRIAYERLLRELHDNHATLPVLPVQTSSFTQSPHDSQHRSKVEILEIGWRH